MRDIHSFAGEYEYTVCMDGWHKQQQPFSGITDTLITIIPAIHKSKKARRFTKSLAVMCWPTICLLYWLQIYWRCNSQTNGAAVVEDEILYNIDHSVDVSSELLPTHTTYAFDVCAN